MKFISRALRFGVLMALGTVSCKNKSPAPEVTPERARPEPSASASSLSSAQAPEAGPAPITALDVPYTADDMAEDIQRCAGYWSENMMDYTEGCEKLLDVWSAGGVDVATKKYKAGCDQNDARSCLFLVGSIFHPKSPMRVQYPPEAREEEARLLLKACELGEPNSCIEIASLHFCIDESAEYLPKVACTTRVNQFLHEKGAAELAALLAPGCKKNHARSCTQQGTHVRRASESRLNEVQELYARGCDLGDANGCAYAAEIKKLFGQEAEQKEFTRKELALMERECRRFHDCSKVAGRYRSGRGGFKDVTKARALFSFMCEKKGPKEVVCLDLADMQAAGEGGPVDTAAAIPRFQAFCDRPVDDDKEMYEIEVTAQGCRGLARLYRDGTGVPKDEAKAAQLLKKVCVKRSPSSEEIDAACRELASLSAAGEKKAGGVKP